MQRTGKNIGKILNRIAVLFAIGAISFYQLVLSPIFTIVLGARCRYSVSCSTYAKQKIKRFGLIKGSGMAIVRLLSCQPFARIQQR